VSALDRAAGRLKAWRGDTTLFARECFDKHPFVPDDWQRDVNVAFDDTVDIVQRIAMQACAGPGKSAEMAILGWKSLSCYAERGEHPQGIALSITADNLRDGLWKELAIWYNRSTFLQAAFEMTATSIHARDYPDTWFLRARAFAKTADPETQGRALDGLHSPYIVYLLDETGSMNPVLLRKAEQGLNNCKWGRLVIAGNPTSTSGALYAAVNDNAANFTVVRITGDPDDPKRSPRINKEWAQQQIAQYGRENPWVQAYILGLFPTGGLNTVLTPDEVRAAMGRNPAEQEFEWAQKRLGIDVARFGDDRTVIFPRQGVVASQPVILRGQRTDVITARVLNMKRSFDSELDFIDDTGHWGHGVVDGLLAAGQGAQAVMFSDPAINPRYGNRRAEMWFEMADWIKTRGSLPNIPELIPELTQPQYYFAPSGKLMLESKDQIKKRLQRSPDLADALALTFAWPDQPGLTSANRGRTLGKAVTDYDPHAEMPRYA
jgi:phage terminase large subunit